MIAEMSHQQNINVQDHEVIVVGSGIAGLFCALSLAPSRVTLITKTPSLAGGSSYWAKGGIAAALGPGDSPKKHAMDTLAAGAGLSDPQGALALAEDGVASLQLLIDEGVPFDRALDGTLDLAREAAHNHARVVHAGGDATGEILVSALIDRVLKSTTIQVLENTFAYDLVTSDTGVDGLIANSLEKGWVFHRSQNIVLATGGIGMTWWNTTNPKESTGDGLAMAARAGARLADLEFMQFHPTALAGREASEDASLPLLTEALRGAGAQLRDESGYRFMQAVHANAALARTRCFRRPSMLRNKPASIREPSYYRSRRRRTITWAVCRQIIWAERLYKAYGLVVRWQRLVFTAPIDWQAILCWKVWFTLDGLQKTFGPASHG